MVERRPKSSTRGDGGEYSGCVDWYLMMVCVGIDGLCPPLCKWSDLSDGTYNLCDVERFTQAMMELIELRKKEQ